MCPSLSREQARSSVVRVTSEFSFTSPTRRRFAVIQLYTWETVGLLRDSPARGGRLGQTQSARELMQGRPSRDHSFLSAPGEGPVRTLARGFGPWFERHDGAGEPGRGRSSGGCWRVRWKTGRFGRRYCGRARLLLSSEISLNVGRENGRAGLTNG